MFECLTIHIIVVVIIIIIIVVIIVIVVIVVVVVVNVDIVYNVDHGAEGSGKKSEEAEYIERVWLAVSVLVAPPS